ncbi:MAG TPA: MFS transporter [Candidatus Methylacidiphilales bacterium]
MNPTPPAPPSASSAAPAALPRLFRAGTLSYTRPALASLFFWLFWGDFAFTFFEQIFRRFIPLYLNEIHASNALIGILTGSVAGVMNILFAPYVSRWSDRLRTPLGRRIPLLYLATPLTVLSLVGIGFVPELAGWIERHFLVRLAPGIAAGGVGIALLCSLSVSFHFFNMGLVNGYNWLLRDVVPLEVMARFLSWFRVVSTLGSCFFLWWVFPHILTARHAVFLGVGVCYLVSFLLMCRNVREGDYPPPDDADSPGLVKSFTLYFRDCLRVPLYRYFFMAWVCAELATSCSSPFSVLFAKANLHLDMAAIGKIFAVSQIVSAVVCFPAGWLGDRFHPMRLAFAGLAGWGIAALAAFAFVGGEAGFLAYNVLGSFPAACWALGSMAASMALFPVERFGRFASALNVFSCAALIFGNYGIGKLMDFVHSDYRLAFLWSGIFYGLAIVPMALAYREWKRHGGPDAYVAPSP